MNFRKWPFGEIVLWIGFAFFTLHAIDGSGVDDPVTMAGLFALSAIGVRATRIIPHEAGDAAE